MPARTPIQWYGSFIKHTAVHTNCERSVRLCLTGVEVEVESTGVLVPGRHSAARHRGTAAHDELAGIRDGQTSNVSGVWSRRSGEQEEQEEEQEKQDQEEEEQEEEEEEEKQHQQQQEQQQEQEEEEEEEKH